MSIILYGAGVYHHYHSCQDIQEEQEFKQGTGWVRVNIEVNFVLIIPIESLFCLFRLKLTLMLFTLAETYFEVLGLLAAAYYEI